MSVRRRLAYLFLKVKMLRMLRDNFFTFYNLIKKLRFLKGKQSEFYNEKGKQNNWYLTARFIK